MTERFTLLSELGRGGMGVVWKARDEETGRTVALKILRETYAEDPEYITRFERELELAKRIHSRNVVQVIGYGVRDKTPYLALEFVDGPSLRERLTTHGPYNWSDARALLAQISQGLADAHAAGVVHRDLKPSNVLIGSDGVAKLADFGIAKGLDLTRMTATSTLLGTPAYLAPEGPADERSDLYSLGVIAFEILTGVVPFEGRTYQEVILRHVREAPDLQRLPEEARPVVGWLLAKDAADRPQRTAELLPVLWGGASAPAQAAPNTAGQQKFVALLPPIAPAKPEPSLSTPAPSVAAGPVAPSPGPGPQGVTPHPGSMPGSWSQTPARQEVRAPVKPKFAAIGLVVCLVSVLAIGLFVALQPAPQSALQPQTWPAVTSTLLRTGEVLVVGGSGDASAEIYDPGTGSFTRTGSMTAASRSGATASLLNDGRVLLVGGSGDAAAELYDPNAGQFLRTGSMTAASRSGATATLLIDGDVLIAGGSGDAAAELYDPNTGSFTRTGSMTVGNRSGATATLLNDGQVLLVGGSGDAAAELYDPNTGSFTRTGSMTAASRSGATATLLIDGDVLIVGGSGDALAELYDPATGSFTPTGSMTAASRSGATATLLNDGRVLLAGGTGDASAELYDPATGSFTRTGSLTAARLVQVAVGGSSEAFSP
jgi:hypothetical protein